MFSIFVGLVVGKAVVLAAGNRRGTYLQVLAIILSILSIVIAKGLIASWTFWPDVQARGILSGLASPWRRIAVFAMGFLIQMRPLDLAWYAIAFFEGWLIARMPHIPISGPHRLNELRARSGA